MKTHLFLLVQLRAPALAGEFMLVIFLESWLHEEMSFYWVRERGNRLIPLDFGRLLFTVADINLD